ASSLTEPSSCPSCLDPEAGAPWVQTRGYHRSVAPPRPTALMPGTLGSGRGATADGRRGLQSTDPVDAAAPREPAAPRLPAGGALGGPGAVGGGEDPLADAVRLRGDLQQLVGGQ